MVHKKKIEKKEWTGPILFPGSVPYPCFGMTMTPFQNRLVMFGGNLSLEEETLSNEIFILNLSKNDLKLN